jgi:hypothetical protein
MLKMCNGINFCAVKIIRILLSEPESKILLSHLWKGGTPNLNKIDIGRRVRRAEPPTQAPTKKKKNKIEATL